jgi:hypothetical protein
MKWKRVHTAAVLGFIIGVALLGVIATQLELTTRKHDLHLGFWFAIILGVLLLALMVVVGMGISGRADGILIDSRNRISLATFQLVVWTLVVLASYGGAFYTNLLAGQNPLTALDISIPPDLWIALGISAASFGGAAGIGAIQKGKGASQVDASGTQTSQGLVAVKPTAAAASWGDLFAADQASENMTTDIAKVQMFFFTVVLAFGYAAGVANVLLGATSHIGALPALNSGFVTLLAVSQGGYLGKKAIPQPQTQPTDTLPTAPG